MMVYSTYLQQFQGHHERRHRKASDKGLSLHLSVLSINKQRPALLCGEVFIDFFFSPCISMHLAVGCVLPLDTLNLSSFCSLFCTNRFNMLSPDSIIFCKYCFFPLQNLASFINIKTNKPRVSRTGLSSSFPPNTWFLNQFLTAMGKKKSMLWLWKSTHICVSRWHLLATVNLIKI